MSKTVDKYSEKKHLFLLKTLNTRLKIGYNQKTAT